MSTDPVISVEGVSKKFCRSLKQTMLYGVRDVVCDVLGLSQSSNGLRQDEFWALDDVSFKVKRGECLGLIGPNGAGKSTLLKLLNGITHPDKGTIKITGRTSALLELGAGFHPMLTGRENIRLSGAILGLSQVEVEKKFDAIVDFAGLAEFIDSPVKHYSSGMYVRLGFAIATHAEPDVLLIDEALAVGDILFQSKCYAKLREFKDRGITIIFVTHSLDLATTHCSRALLLDRGIVVAEGGPKEVVDRYNRVIVIDNSSQTSGQSKSRKEQSRESSGIGEIVWAQYFKLNPYEDRYGSKKAEILEAGIFTLDNNPVQVTERNQEYVIKIKVRHNEAMPAAIVAYTIKDPRGIVLCGSNTLFHGVDMGRMNEGDVIVVAFKQSVRLNPGKFFLCVGLANYENDKYVVYDRRFDYMSFEVVGTQQRVGLFDLDSTVEWTRCGIERGF
jgi:ABC-type polysaccharide/polyol phosphate transport system ATPase subunit